MPSTGKLVRAGAAHHTNQTAEPSWCGGAHCVLAQGTPQPCCARGPPRAQILRIQACATMEHVCAAGEPVATTWLHLLFAPSLAAPVQ